MAAQIHRCGLWIDIILTIIITGQKRTSNFRGTRQTRCDLTTDTTAIMATGVDAKLLKSTKFPPEFNQKVDMTKVNLQVMKKYVLKHSRRALTCHGQFLVACFARC
jgi:hypothetical protein